MLIHKQFYTLVLIDCQKKQCQNLANANPSEILYVGFNRLSTKDFLFVSNIIKFSFFLEKEICKSFYIFYLNN